MSGMLDIPFTQFKLMCTAVGLYKLLRSAVSVCTSRGSQSHTTAL